MSAGKPLGSRAVLLLDLDFSFLRRGKQKTGGQRSPPLARGCRGAQTAPEKLLPFLSPSSPGDVLVQAFSLSFLGTFLTERQNFSHKGFRIRSERRS